MGNTQGNDLLESRHLRKQVMDRDHVLDRVKPLTLLPDDLHVTTAMVAGYFEVSLEAIRALVHDHRAEIEENGYQVLTGSRLSYFKQRSGIQSRGRSLALFSRRAVLNVAMLLRDSNVARQVRSYLLDAERGGRQPHPAAPVDNFVDGLADWVRALVAEEVQRCLTDLLEQRIDEALEWRAERFADDRVASVARDMAREVVREVMAQAVTPLLNTAIHASGELLRRVTESEAELDRIARVLREREPAAARGAVDRLGRIPFADHIASLCRRDRCRDVVLTGRRQSFGVDVVGRTGDGRRMVVRCDHRHTGEAVDAADIRRFIGVVKVDHRADLALYAATRRITGEARELAARRRITVVDRERLAAWLSGEAPAVLG